MKLATTSKQPWNDPYEDTTPNVNYEDIVIERREEIGRVKVDPNGTGNALEYAFQIASGYVTENTRTGDNMNVEFTFGNHIFHVGSTAK